MIITREIFAQQCKRRFGTANPERMRLDCWEWMVRRGEDPFGVREEFDLERDGLHDGPDWCFVRFGMSRTFMPDGRIICVAGEHEDYYDPDYCVYNDVIVLRPAPGEAGVTLEAGTVEIYGYPESVFPPTDFHSATLVNGTIFLIGQLGYDGTRTEGVTPVLVLDTATYRIEGVPTTGPCPGWIYEHHASYDTTRHAITVRGGKLNVEGAKTETPHLAAHRLYLADLRWELIAERETHSRFVIETEDDLGPDIDWEEASMFLPKNVPHGVIEPRMGGVMIYGLDVQGVRIVFEVYYSVIRVLVEGDLRSELVRAVLDEVTENLNTTMTGKWSWREGDWERDTKSC
jgi:hypothetical protein